MEKLNWKDSVFIWYNPEIINEMIESLLQSNTKVISIIFQQLNWEKFLQYIYQESLQFIDNDISSPKIGKIILQFLKLLFFIYILNPDYISLYLKSTILENSEFLFDNINLSLFEEIFNGESFLNLLKSKFYKLNNFLYFPRTWFY